MNCETEIILNNKIIQYGNFLISVCNDDNKKLFIQNKVNNLKSYDIMLMMIFYSLKEDKDTEIRNLMKEFSIIDNDDNFNEIKEQLNYFLNVYNILKN